MWKDLWSNELASGHMQLVVQTNRRQAVRMLPRNAVVPMDFKSALSDTDVDPIVWLRHPLTREAYIDLIRQSDMAVFLHEDRAYYTRCSGVLVEMLAGGVPVLVPAGSWLADQVSESIYEHLDGLRSTAPGIGRAPVERVHGRTGYPGTGGSVLSLCGGTAADAACELEVPAGTCAALVSCPWHAHACPGTYLRLAAEPVGQLAAQDSLSEVTILGPRPGGKPVAALVPVPAGTRRIKLRLRNAYDDEPLPVSNLEVRFLGPPANGASSYAAGRVGLVFADVDQLPRLVRNMREHYAHYLESARDFAATWRHQHDAQRIVERLLECDGSPRLAVA